MCKLFKVYQIPVPLKLFAGSKLLAHQVPGDGSCLFYAIMGGLQDLAHCDKNSLSRYAYRSFDSELACKLRSKAINCLQDKHAKFIVGPGFPEMTSSDLLKLAASDYGMSCTEYCKEMRKKQSWGGGPEIISLAHYLKLPIDVYELKSKKSGLFSREFGE